MPSFCNKTQCNKYGVGTSLGVEQLQAEDMLGQLPIHHAAAHSTSPEVVNLLLEEGGTDQLRRAAPCTGWTPLHCAVR